MNMDKISEVVLTALDVLFTKYENRTALGAIVGIVLIGVCNVCEPYITEALGYNFPFMGYIAVFFLGVLILHLPTVLSAYKGTSSDDRYESALKMIDNTPEFSTKEKRELKRKVIQEKINTLSDHRIKKKQEEVEKADNS